MTSFMDSLRRGLDRASFEADKLMRYNRVRGEAVRVQTQSQEQVHELGERALALYAAGTLHNSELTDLAREITDLRERARQKEAEAAAIQGEVWIEPPMPPAMPGAPPPAPGPSVAPVAPAAPPAPAAPWTPPPAAPAAPPSWSSGPARPLGPIEDQGTHRIPPPDRNAYCPVCGAPLRPQAAFCAQCGVRL